ncbi:hypothetical protein D3C73_1605860 [compost metagenome]
MAVVKPTVTSSLISGPLTVRVAVSSMTAGVASVPFRSVLKAPELRTSKAEARTPPVTPPVSVT